MKELLQPIKTDSLVDVFIQKFEELILSGKISIGQKLPSERELALQLGVSRPVVHEGLLHMEAKGLVTMIPRVGTLVNDYRREGSLALLDSLVHYHRGRMDAGLFKSLLQMRYLVELETARLAALYRTEAHLTEFGVLLENERNSDPRDNEAVTGLDFSFHHLVAIASGNMIYPLLLNSFREVYTNFTSIFFRDSTVAAEVFCSHEMMVEAMAARDWKKTVKIMKRVIDHGERHLISLLAEDKNPEVTE